MANPRKYDAGIKESHEMVETSRPIDDSAASDFSVQEPEYPKPMTVALIMLALCLAVFLVALDQTIIATVSLLKEMQVPVITY
jgi:hypothetical protein